MLKISDLALSRDPKEREKVGRYLRYLRVISGNTNSSAASFMRVDARTFSNVLAGKKVSKDTAIKLDHLVEEFIRNVNDKTVATDFDTWNQTFEASKRHNEDSEKRPSNTQEENSEETSEATADAVVTDTKRLWWGGAGILGVVLAVLVLFSKSTCLLPTQCEPQDIGYLDIGADYNMRLNADSSGFQQSAAIPLITLSNQPYFYVESDHVTNFVDANVSIIDRTNGEVAKKFEFEGDPKTYPEPYTDDQDTFEMFDFEVVECVAIQLNSKNVWVKEFQVRQPDTERIRDLIAQKRRDSFNLVTVFNPEQIISENTLECPEDIRTDPLYEAFKDSGAGQPLLGLNSHDPIIANEPLKSKGISLDAGDVKFGGSWWSGVIRLNATISADLPSGTEFHVSKDGLDFSRGLEISDLMPEDQFIVRLSNPSWAEDAGPFDFTELAQTAAAVVVEKEFGRNDETIIRCEPGSCEIANYTFCNGNWQKLSLGRRPGDQEAFIDFSDCDPSNIDPICLSTPIDLFPIAPGQSVFGALQSVAGGTYEFEFSALPLIGRFQEGAPFVPLVALTKDAPPAFALYSVWGHSGTDEVRYSMALAAKGCLLGSEEIFKAVYYDVDGKGNVRGDLQGFWIPEPERDFIAITLEGKDNTIYGPYRYAFPNEDIISNAVGSIEPASTFECRRKLSNRFDAKSWKYHCFAPSTYQTVFEWADVAEVQVGPSPDDLSTIIPVNLSNKEIVERHAQTRQGAAPPLFEYSPPRDRRDLYFSIVYKDGTQSLVQRLKLPDPL